MNKVNATSSSNIESLFSTIELKDACKDAETRYLKHVFREAYVANLRTTDLIAHLEHMAMEHRFYNDIRYKRLVKELNKLSRTLGALINGEKGERRAGKALRHLFVHNKTLHGVCLEFDGEQAEIDYVVITSKGIFPIEVKYYTFDVTIDDCGSIHAANYHWNKSYSVGEKLRAKEYVLSNVLKPELGPLAEPVNIHSMLLFANDERSYTDEFHCYPTCCCGDVAQKIEGFDGDDVFTDEQIQQIDSAILGKTFVPRYPSDVHFDEIEADLDYIMGLIEADGADEYADANGDALECGVIDDTDNDDTLPPVAYSSEEDMDWLWMAGCVPVALLAGYGLYRHPSAIRKLARLVRL